MNRHRVTRTGVMWALFLPGAVGATGLSMAMYDPVSHLPTDWVAPAAFAGVFMLAWHQGAFRWRRAALIVAFCALGGVVLGPPLGYGVSESLRVVLIPTTIQLLLMACYRERSTNGEWFPESPARVLDLAALQALGACVIVLAGGVPYLWWADDAALSGTILWCVRMSGNLIFAAFVAFSALMPPNPTYSRHEYQRYLPLIVPLCAVCLVIPFLLPPYPLDWVILVPAVAIGIIMTTRTVGGAALAAAGVPAVFRDSPHWSIQQGHLIHPFSVMELLLISALLLRFVLVSFRERRARLVEETRAAAAQAAAQTELLRSVVQTMSDGVLLTDTTGRIVLANPAARTMLGRPTTGSTETGWASSFDLRAAGGTALTPEQIRELMSPPADSHARLTVTVPSTEGEEARFFALTSRASATVRTSSTSCSSPTSPRSSRGAASSNRSPRRSPTT